MKFTDKLVSKYGADKLLHFAFPMIPILAVSLINVIAGIIAFIVICLLCFIKEKFLDDFFDKKDFIAGILGGSISLLFVILVKVIIKLI